MLTATLLLLVACTGEKDDTATTPTTESDADTDADADADADADTDTDTDTDVAPTWSADVWPILESNCVLCHQDDTYNPGFKLDTASGSYTALTTDTPNMTDSGFTAYVVPGDPDASLLVHKLEQATPSYGGAQMPLNPETYQSAPLSSGDQATVRAWVAAGAMND